MVYEGKQEIQRNLNAPTEACTSPKRRNGRSSDEGEQKVWRPRDLRSKPRMRCQSASKFTPLQILRLGKSQIWTFMDKYGHASSEVCLLTLQIHAHRHGDYYMYLR